MSRKLLYEVRAQETFFVLADDETEAAERIRTMWAAELDKFGGLQNFLVWADPAQSVPEAWGDSLPFEAGETTNTQTCDELMRGQRKYFSDRQHWEAHPKLPLATGDELVPTEVIAR